MDEKKIVTILKKKKTGTTYQKKRNSTRRKDTDMQYFIVNWSQKKTQMKIDHENTFTGKKSLKKDTIYNSVPQK